MVIQLSQPRSELQVTTLNEIPLVQMPVCLSLPEAIALETIYQHLWQKKPTKIVFDFSRTTYISSSGIGVLFHILKPAKEKGIELVAWSMQPQVKTTLLMAGINPFLTLDSGTQAITPADTHQIKVKEQLSADHPSVRSRVKRLIDILGAFIGLGITAVLFIPIAIAIKLDSPGPVLYSQACGGLRGRHFQLWKFRTSANNKGFKWQAKHQVNNYSKSGDQPPLTRIGQLLRRMSLDGLPQFWNVLKGEMSLVGTYPPPLDELARYTVPLWQHLDVKPGITGEWKINCCSQFSASEDSVQIDLFYQHNWSLAYDFKLVLKTLLIKVRSTILN